jgi:predicted acetyltransferase
VLTEMMRTQLDDVHERGEPIAALWSSEEAIYPRFGYGMASLAGEISIARDRAAFALPYEPAGRMRLVAPDEAKTLLPPVWDAARPRTPGFFGRPAAWWEDRIVREPEERPQGTGAKRFAVHDSGGEVDGYAIYRHASSWDQGVSTSTLRVVEAIAASPEVMREVWRYLLDIDQQQTIAGRLLPLDHPLFLLLAEPRRLKFRIHDALWVRLVDVGAALSGRGYAAEGRVVFEVQDDFCPWNAGRWRLEGSEATRSEDEPDLRLDVTALGSVFLGGFTFAELRRACRVEEAREGAVARADAIFRTDVAPWCPEIF